MGAKVKITGLDKSGVIFVFITNFSPSEMGCSSPNKPTTLGPFRR